MSATRIDVRDARSRVEDSDALLVCAYDDQEKFESNRLQNAISLNELRSREDELSKDRELIFY